jgi:hypothetical protein
LTSPKAPTRAPEAIERALADLVTDQRVGGMAATRAAPGTLWFTPDQLAFLRQATARGSRPVVISGESTELSGPMAQALQYHAGGWAVREAGGWRNGFTGRRIAAPQAAVDQARAADLNDLSLSFLRHGRSDYAQLMVCATARRPADRPVLPGETVELLMAAVGAAGGGDSGAWAFSRTEPARRPWDAAELAWLCERDQAAGAPLSAFVVSGSPAAPASLTLVLQHQAEFTFEHVTGLVGLGRLGDPSLKRKLAAVDQMMETLSRASGITFALVMVRAGNEALTRPPILPSAPIPLSILLGDELVDGLGIDPRWALREFQASPALGGRGLMVPLDSAASGRPHLAEFFKSADLDRAVPRMGISPQQLQRLHYAARY